MNSRAKLIRISTVPQSLHKLLNGQLKFMNNYYEVIGIASSGEQLRRVKEENGIRVIPVEMTRAITPLKDLKALWQLYKIFRREKPLIVHTHTPKAGTLGIIAAKLANVPYRLHTVAGLPLLEERGTKRKLLNTVEKFTYACATKVYPNSSGLREIIIRNGYATKDKLKVIGNGSSNGIDTDYFNTQNISHEEKRKLKKELNICLDDYVFIFVGRLVKDKGVNELVKAFIKLSTKYKNVKLLILGKFEENLDPLDVETQYQLKNTTSIIYAGYQNDVRPYFAISNALAFPSYREGFPNVVMQAGAMSLPAIVTNINGCNEIIRDKQNGLIVPVKNANILFEKMEYLLLHPDKCLEMGNYSRELNCKYYNRELIWKELLEEYERLENKQDNT